MPHGKMTNKTTLAKQLVCIITLGGKEGVVGHGSSFQQAFCLWTHHPKFTDFLGGFILCTFSFMCNRTHKEKYGELRG